MLKNSRIPDAIAEAMTQRGYEKLTPVQEEVVKKKIFWIRFISFCTNWIG